MFENENELKEILNVLNKEGFLPNTILIGSWCLLFYKYVFEHFEPTIRTTDIDFFVPNPKSIKEKNGIVNSLKEVNYDLVHDTLTNKTTFISPNGFELEFLTKLNRQNLVCVKLGNTDVYAESLSYVDIFVGNYIEANYDGIKLKVASPSSYVLQKLLINGQRKVKSEKDIESIKNVLLYIGASRKFKEELQNLFDSLPRKWKREILKVSKANNIVLFK